MWKDYFYFTRGQRVAIILLIVLIVIALIFYHAMPLFFPNDKTVNNDLLNQVDSFKKTLVNINTGKSDSFYSNKKFPENKFESNKQQNKPELFYFDPNTADSTDFIRLGLPRYVASNILKFREKGGYFKTPDGFSRVYGLKPEIYEKLKSYIRIDTSAVSSKDTTFSKKKKTRDSEIAIVVDLNSADTSELLKVKGIGRGYARGILRFRQKAGGFSSVEQLRELYGMTDKNYERIYSYCKVDLSLIRKIEVNTASIDKLKQHPYISFSQARAIYELRRSKGRLSGINELKSLTEFSDNDIIKLTPYLDFQ
ncbi:MAG: helix-hairpin-helix domain-containing protein [Paludibacter sp.]|nr:helix-hairpin-helix domain-containing protein [Paludibacter sp.]